MPASTGRGGATAACIRRCAAGHGAAGRAAAASAAGACAGGARAARGAAAGDRGGDARAPDHRERDGERGGEDGGAGAEQAALAADRQSVSSWNTTLGVAGAAAVASAAAAGYLWYRALRGARVEVHATPTGGGVSLSGRF